MPVRMILAMVACLLVLNSDCPAAGAEPPLPTCQPWNSYQELWVSPAFRDDHTLFVRSQRLLRSQDAGLTWTELSPSDPEDVYPSLNYVTDRTLYVLGSDPAIDQGVFWRSTDGGDTWTLHGLPPAEWGLDVVPVNPDLVYAARGGGPPVGTSDQGVFRTADAGATWTRLLSGQVYSIALSPQFAADQTLLVGYGPLSKSTDGGQTWQPRNVNHGLAGYNPDGGIGWIQYAPGFAENRTIFLNYGGVLFRSTDAGDSWQDVTWRAGLPFWIWEQVVSPRYASDHTLWAWVWTSAVAGCYPDNGPCRPAGSYISRNGGETWEQLPAPEKLAVQGAGEWRQSDGTCGVVLFSRYYDPAGQTSLLKSYDYGQTWQCLEDPTPPGGQPAPPPADIPEPATWLLLAGGLAGVAGWRWRARRRSGGHVMCQAACKAPGTRGRHAGVTSQPQTMMSHMPSVVCPGPDCR